MVGGIFIEAREAIHRNTENALKYGGNSHTSAIPFFFNLLYSERANEHSLPLFRVRLRLRSTSTNIPPSFFL